MSTLFNTIILLGAIQGFIVSVLLFRRRRHPQAERLLAFLILLMSMASFNLYFYNTRFFEQTDLLRVIAAIVPLVIIMPMGPLIYFYIKSVLDPSFVMKKSQRRQFYTTIIDIIPELTALVFVITALLKKADSHDAYAVGLFIDRYNMYVDIPRFLSLTIYIILSYKYIRKEKRRETTDQQRMTKIKWLQQFITVFLVFQAIWFAYLIPYVMPAYSNRLLALVGWYPIYIPLAIMIYWLGIKGYLFTYVVAEPRKKALALAESIIRDTGSAVKKAMEEDKIYLNPALSLEGMAAHTGIPAKTISGVLNQHLGQSFTEWVNGYRLEAFKQKLKEGRLEQLAIAAIAAECGFNSQASFQRIFKQSLGMTPTEYINNTH